MTEPEKNNFLPQSIIWKAILLIFMVWGIVGTVYSTGLTERKEAIKANTALSTENAKNIAAFSKDIEWIKAALKTIMDEARIENKRREMK